MSPQQWLMLQYMMGQGGSPTLADLLRQGGFQTAGDVVPFGSQSILPGLVGPEGRAIDLGGGAEMLAQPPLITPGQYPFMPQTDPSLRYLLRHGAANEASLNQLRYG